MLNGVKSLVVFKIDRKFLTFHSNYIYVRQSIIVEFVRVYIDVCFTNRMTEAYDLYVLINIFLAKQDVID